MPAVSQAARMRQRGFTMIELMITVVIIGILASIAYPSYVQYIIRGNRADAEAQMMDIANREQQFFFANRAYTGTLSDLGGYTLPTELSTRYTAQPPTVDNAATPPTFSITFTAKGPQLSDGNLTLDNQGVKTPASKW